MVDKNKIVVNETITEAVEELSEWNDPERLKAIYSSDYVHRKHGN